MGYMASIQKDKKTAYHQKKVQIVWDLMGSVVVRSQLSVQYRAKNHSL